MKSKKLRFIVLSFFAFFGTFIYAPGVNAIEESTCYSTMRMTKSTRQILFRGEVRNMYFMNLGSELALCMDPGKHMYSGTQLIPGGCPEASISVKTKKALNYCAKNGCGEDITQVVAQVYAWGGSVLDMRPAICSYFNWPVFKAGSKGKSINDLSTTCRVNTEKGYERLWAGIDSSSSTGKFYCNTTGDPAFQRIATLKRPKCEASDPDKLVCPPGTLNAGMDITEQANEVGYQNAVLEYCGEVGAACIGNAVDLTGSLAVCQDNNQSTESFFRETIGASSPDYFGSKENGRKMDVNIGEGSYCALYCLETKANAILPGGLANPIAIGSAITWPTSEATSSSKWGNMFPVSFSGEKRCRLQVAPNLTYGNSCELEPVEQYKEAIEKIKPNYDAPGKKYTSLKNLGETVNKGKYLNYSGSYTTFTATKLEDTYILEKNNEEIRVDIDKQTAYLNQFDIYKPEDGKLYKFVTVANSNASKANSAYSSEWNGYCNAHRKTSADPVYSCKNGHKSGDDCVDNYGVVIGSPERTGWRCHNGRSSDNNGNCYCNETAANNESGSVRTLNDIKQKWTSFKNEVNSRFNRYKSYITAYQNALGIYHQIKLCNNFGTNAGDADEGGSNFSCSGQYCDFYHFVTDAVMEYTDEGNEYGRSYGLVLEKDTSYSCTGCESPHSMKVTNTLLSEKYTGYKNMTNSSVQGPEYMKAQIDAIEKRTMTITASEATYSLPPNLYNYINKETNKYSMTKPNGNYETVGLSKNYDFLYSNLPTSYNNKVNKKYNLVIKSITLGDNGQFHAGAAGVSISDYICHYTVATDFDECICPPGTKYVGIDLYQALLDSNGALTCADAKRKYCDADNVPECDTNCVQEKYCSNDPTIKITACVNSGMSVSKCEDLLCNNKYYCPTNTKNAGMDMTSCVQTKIAQGYSVDKAKKYCANTVCNGMLAIYRTIDLRNPFPSIDADSSISQSNLRHGMFNLNVKGRYPGYNWNGVEVVKTEIIQNRDVSNYEVYSEKPLYHFELDTATIMDIREYNRKQAQNDDGYNDFTLECVQDDQKKYLGTACLSKKFVHDPKYGGDTTGTRSLCGGAGTTTTLSNCLYKSNGN